MCFQLPSCPAPIAAAVYHRATVVNTEFMSKMSSTATMAKVTPHEIYIGQRKVKKSRAAQMKCYPHIVLCEDSAITGRRTDISMLCRFVRSSGSLVQSCMLLATSWVLRWQEQQVVSEILQKVLAKPDHIKFISYRKVANKGRSAWLIIERADKMNGKGENTKPKEAETSTITSGQCCDIYILLWAKREHLRMIQSCSSMSPWMNQRVPCSSPFHSSPHTHFFLEAALQAALHLHMLGIKFGEGRNRAL